MRNEKQPRKEDKNGQKIDKSAETRRQGVDFANAV